MRHFKKLLNGIIEHDGRHTISSLNASQIETRDVINDIEFIRNTNWTCEELLKLNRDFLKSIAKKSDTGFSIIDDTVIEKFESFRREKMYCLVDRWYTSEKVVKAAKEREFEIIGALKGNRVLNKVLVNHNNRG